MNNTDTSYSMLLNAAKKFETRLKDFDSARSSVLKNSSERDVQTNTDGSLYGQFTFVCDTTALSVSYYLEDDDDFDFKGHFWDAVTTVSKEMTSRSEMNYDLESVSWRGEMLEAIVRIKPKSPKRTAQNIRLAYLNHNF